MPRFLAVQMLPVRFFFESVARDCEVRAVYKLTAGTSGRRAAAVRFLIFGLEKPPPQPWPWPLNFREGLVKLCHQHPGLGPLPRSPPHVQCAHNRPRAYPTKNGPRAYPAPIPHTAHRTDPSPTPHKTDIRDRRIAFSMNIRGHTLYFYTVLSVLKL